MKSPSCPNCNEKMRVIRLYCPSCDITVKGHFLSDRYSSLDTEDLLFMERFILARGNLKDLQEDLNLSYPTVRNKLDKLVVSMQALHHYDRQEKIKKDATQAAESRRKSIIAKHSNNH